MCIRSWAERVSDGKNTASDNYRPVFHKVFHRPEEFAGCSCATRTHASPSKGISRGRSIRSGLCSRSRRDYCGGFVPDVAGLVAAGVVAPGLAAAGVVPAGLVAAVPAGFAAGAATPD